MTSKKGQVKLTLFLADKHKLTGHGPGSLSFVLCHICLLFPHKALYILNWFTLTADLMPMAWLLCWSEIDILIGELTVTWGFNSKYGLSYSFYMFILIKLNISFKIIQKVYVCNMAMFQI